VDPKLHHERELSSGDDDHPASSEEFVERARDLEGTFETSGCPDAGHPPDIFPERLHLLAFICSMVATRNVYSSHYSRDLTGNRKISIPFVSSCFAASPHKHRVDSAWRNPADVMLLAESRVLPTVPFGCKSRPVPGPDREGPERAARIVRDRGRKHLACSMLPQVGCVEASEEYQRATLRIALKRDEGSVGDTCAHQKNLSGVCIDALLLRFRNGSSDRARSAGNQASDRYRSSYRTLGRAINAPVSGREWSSFLLHPP